MTLNLYSVYLGPIGPVVLPVCVISEWIWVDLQSAPIMWCVIVLAVIKSVFVAWRKVWAVRCRKNGLYCCSFWWSVVGLIHRSIRTGTECSWIGFPFFLGLAKLSTSYWWLEYNILDLWRPLLQTAFNYCTISISWITETHNKASNNWNVSWKVTVLPLCPK